MNETKQPGGRTVSFYAEFSLIEWLEKRAESENRTISNTVETLLKEAKKTEETK